MNTKSPDATLQPLPCPFCGFAAEIDTVIGSTGWMVQCPINCIGDIATHIYPTEQEAVESWNKRVTPSAIAPSKPRSTYVPLTAGEIEAIRSRGEVSKKAWATLCDMAINCLLYADEIDRLRVQSATESMRNEIITRCAQVCYDYSRTVEQHNSSAAVAAIDCARRIEQLDTPSTRINQA